MATSESSMKAAKITSTPRADLLKSSHRKPYVDPCCRRGKPHNRAAECDAYVTAPVENDANLPPIQLTLRANS